MNVLVLENELSSSRGGQEHSLVDVCEGLARRGHGITVAFVESGDLEPRYRRFCRDMIRVRNYAIDRTRTIASAGDFVASQAVMRRADADLVYANQYFDSLAAAAFSWRARVPFVCHMRLPPPGIMAGQYRIGMKRAVRLIATSEATRAEWVRRGFGRDRIDVVPNGIDVARFRPRPDDRVRADLGVRTDAVLVTYAGRLHPAKGVETLLDAAAILAASMPVRLAIAGTPAPLTHDDGTPRDYPTELRLRVDRLGLRDAVVWLGHVADVAGLLAATDVTAVPSTWSEPFGRVVIESLACGTPVVASRTGGIPEVLTGEFASWLVPPGDPRALADAIRTARERSAEDPALPARCRAHVQKHFTVDQMVAGVERAFVRALDDWRGGADVSPRSA